MKIKINSLFKKFSFPKKTKKQKVDANIQIAEEMKLRKRRIPIQGGTTESQDEDSEKNRVEDDNTSSQRQYKRKGARSNYYGFKLKQVFKQFFKNTTGLPAGYYVLLLAMLGLGTVSVILTVESYNKINKENYSVYSSIDSGNENNDNDNDVDVSTDNSNTKTDESSIEENNSQIVQTSTNIDTNNQEKAVKQETKQEVKVEKPVIQPLKFIKPINGNIIKPHSPNDVIYSKTLELWKTHDGVDIAGSIGTDVKSMERGTIEKIYTDAFYGVTVIIDHGQGYKSKYSNLAENVLVKEKQTIKKGNTIGTVGQTAIGEIKDDSHVHIQLYKDGVSINPESEF